MKPEILISPETAEHYGAITDEFAVWAKTQGVKQLLIVAPEDVAYGNDPQALSERKQLAGLTRFLDDFPSFPRDKFDFDLRYPLSLGLALGGVNAQSRSVDIDGDGVHDVAIVSVPSRSATKEQIASLFSSDTPTQNLPGTDLDWQVFTAAHEIGHISIDRPLGAGGRGNTMILEIEAEQDAVHFMKQAHSKGLITDIEVVQAATSIRALSSIFWKSFKNNHDISVGVRGLNEGPAPVESTDEGFITPFHDAEGKVGYEIGKHITPIGDHWETFAGLLSGDSYYYTRERDFSKDDEDIKSVIRNMADDRITIEDGLDQLEQLDPDARRIVEGFYKDDIIGAGSNVLVDDPNLQFETARLMYLRGDFDENLIGKQYIYEFLTAAQKYAPNHYNVVNEGETFVPPQFPETQENMSLESQGNHTPLPMNLK